METSATITAAAASVLAHTASNGRYVTDDPAVVAMADRGLLRDYGPQPLAGGMHYLTLTEKGRAALASWRAAQPKPPKSKRRRPSPAFEAWERYCEAFSRIPFGKFWKDIWPQRRWL